METLLHECIHAYLFVTDGNDDHDGHGPAFHSHMHRINKEAQTNISVYHNFHDEVRNHELRPFSRFAKHFFSLRYNRWITTKCTGGSATDPV